MRYQLLELHAQMVELLVTFLDLHDVNLVSGHGGGDQVLPWRSKNWDPLYFPGSEVGFAHVVPKLALKQLL